MLRLAHDAAAGMNNKLRVQLVTILKQVFKAFKPAADLQDTVQLSEDQKHNDYASFALDVAAALAALRTRLSMA